MAKVATPGRQVADLPQEVHHPLVRAARLAAEPQAPLMHGPTKIEKPNEQIVAGLLQSGAITVGNANQAQAARLA